MASNNSKKPEQVASPQAVTKNEPTYTIDEFAKAPESVGATSPDIVSAALTAKGKASYTIEEAKAVIKYFSQKEVK